MSASNVSSCVLNILGSFSSSLGLYKRLKEKRRKLRRVRKSDKADGAEELRLTRSLRQGPEDISHEYHNSLCSAGDRFAIGDAIAQTSLAEVLLRLNVGLVGIITSFVSSDKNDVQLDYQSLADLSERSRIDTCRALRGLLNRLTRFSRPQRAITARGEQGSGSNVKAASSSDLSSNRKRNKTGQQTRPKIRGPTLAQVVIQDSSKKPQIALVRPGERRKKSRSPTTTELSSSKTRNDSAAPPPPSPQQELRPSAERAKIMPDVRKPRRKQSSPNVPTARRSAGEDNQALRASKSTPRLNSTSYVPPESLPTLPAVPDLPPIALPPAPQEAAAASTPNLLPRRRKPTPTYYSIATDSTKLGEIPLHKWAEPYDFDRMEVLNREAYRNGWPNEGGGESSRKRRGGLLGLFRRRRSD